MPICCAQRLKVFFRIIQYIGSGRGDPCNPIKKNMSTRQHTISAKSPRAIASKVLLYKTNEMKRGKCFTGRKRHGLWSSKKSRDFCWENKKFFNTNTSNWTKWQLCTAFVKKCVCFFRFRMVIWREVWELWKLCLLSVPGNGKLRRDFLWCFL